MKKAPRTLRKAERGVGKIGIARARAIVQYYDPLYGVVEIGDPTITTLPQSARRVFLEAAVARCELRNVIRDVLDSQEMDRLNFLKQAGLAFLVYPSATYTRFAHAIGTVHLGLMAMSWIKISEAKQDIKKTLGEFLNSKKLTDEFLLALLLHDIGHYPYSHVLEEMRGLNIPSHEQLGLLLVDGAENDPWIKTFREQITASREADYVSGLLSRTKSLNKQALLYLLGKDPNNNVSNEIRILRELVSGILDLDRIDHYNRDIYFIGTGFGRCNIHMLMNNIVIRARNDGEVVIVLSRDGISQAVNLLYSKLALSRHVFGHPHLKAYEAMLQWCVRKWYLMIKKEDASDRLRQLLTGTDETLMTELLKSSDESVQKMFRRLVSRQPYRYIKKIFLKDIRNNKGLRAKIIKSADYLEAKVDSDGLPSCLVYIPRRFGKPRKEIWMDYRRIVGENGFPLYPSGDKVMEDLFGAFLRCEEEESRTLWVFSDDREKISKMVKYVNNTINS